MEIWQRHASFLDGCLITLLLMSLHVVLPEVLATAIVPTRYSFPQLPAASKPTQGLMCLKSHPIGPMVPKA